MPIKPAIRSEYFQESVIREMTRIALQENAVNLAQGLPDFPPPPEIVQAARCALGSAYDQYSITYGDENLRAAIAEDLRKYTGVIYDPAYEITVTCGVSEGVIAALLALIDPGDEVLFFEPYYENYLPGIILAGGSPVPLELIQPRWDFHPELLEDSITDKTRALIINTPMNPTGRVFSFEELTIIAEICEKHNIVIISDEIYRHFVYLGNHQSPAAVSGLAQNTVIVGGFSKAFSCTGWRVGYTAAKGSAAAAIRKTHDYLTICAPHPFQMACLEGLNKLTEEYYANLRNDFLRRRDLLCYGLLDLGFKLEVPRGAYYVLADFSQLSNMDDMEFAGILAVQGGVAGVPGSSFYVDHRKGKQYIRFSFAATEKKLMSALDRIGERLKMIGGNG